MSLFLRTFKHGGSSTCPQCKRPINHPDKLNARAAQRIGLLCEHCMTKKFERKFGECDCITSGNTEKPKQHRADPHAKNCAVYIERK